ncbi:MAG: 23S rRNA (adenine(2503)-C(2))-methyltransferase RlmN [Lachnospiraceae bacterium]|nr:23S rRNA (adenine(2503)-C(2))-methyltransferase RlmN [Lachnospiraceae bacterium]
MEDLLSMTLPELTEAVTDMGEKKFRARQIYEWIHKKGAASFSEMTNVPKNLREKLAGAYSFSAPEIRTVQESKIDGTRKYLFRMSDGEYVESVLMRYQYGLSVCISSQVGCRMGCSFCASTLLGLTRNLTAGEMLSQVYAIQRDMGERISHVVVMGTGEPMDNYDNLVRFLHMISDENGLHISERDLTVSTCGIVPGIRKLAEEKMAINLALSLHAPNDELRKKIMPVARAYSLKEIFEALDLYYEATKRRLTFEYSLIRGVNDSDECARELSRLLGRRNALVNLIPVNPVRETGYRETARTDVLAFQKKLENYGIHVTIRREMGRDIDGACGQLRKRYEETDSHL